MKATIPNLELLEYQAYHILLKDENTKERIENHWKNVGYRCFEGRMLVDFDIYMFPQTWGSTCTAFDIDENGNPTFGGQALTKAYTVIFYEPISEVYLVFVNGSFAYLVWNPTEEFLVDLKEQSMKSVSEANKYH